MPRPDSRRHRAAAVCLRRKTGGPTKRPRCSASSIGIIEKRSLPFSPRIRTLKDIRGKICPELEREPLPPLKHYAPPRAGAKGIGNGRATTLRFAQEGARILAVDRLIASAEETAAMATQGGECVPFAADVTKEETLAAAMEFITGVALPVDGGALVRVG